MMSQILVHSWQLWDHEHQKRFLWIERKLVMWGHQNNLAPPHILHINHKAHYQPWVMKNCFVLTQGTCDYIIMEAKYKSNVYI
jgi:hypothetical protein